MLTAKSTYKRKGCTLKEHKKGTTKAIPYIDKKIKYLTYKSNRMLFYERR